MKLCGTLRSALSRLFMRMADANTNRAVEGLRVVEDVLRFVYDNRELSRTARHIRHATCRQAAAAFPRRAMLLARDAGNDVGARRFGAGLSRRRIQDLLSANIRRAQESMRVLEETARCSERPGGGKAFQNLRFRLYRLEESIGREMAGRGKGRR